MIITKEYKQKRGLWARGCDATAKEASEMLYNL